MLGLIYPAVLGTILYQLLQTFAHLLKGQYPLNAIVMDQMRLACHFDCVLCLRLSIYRFY